MIEIPYNISAEVTTTVILPNALILNVKYRLLDHTADIQIQAFGSTIDEMFENSAFALFEQIADTGSIRPKGEEKISLESGSLEALLVDFLNELVFLHSTMRYLFCEFKVHVDGLRLECTAKGEKIDRRRHRLKEDVKAVTYHMLEFNTKEGYAKFIIDV